VVNRSAAAKLAVLRALSAWRWLLLWMGLAIVGDALIVDRLPLGARTSVVGAARDWVVSNAQLRTESGGALEFLARAPGKATASRLVPVADGAEFIDLEVCIAQDLAPDQLALMLASEAGAVLDFNRSYMHPMIYGAEAGECQRHALPRRAGDGVAVLQLQQTGPQHAALRVTTLAVTSLTENPVWRWLRQLMLASGLLLIAVCFYRHHCWRRTPAGLVSLAGLGGVAGILFGCVVSVELKADIFAIVSGGRELPVAKDLATLLATPFPVGDFAFFTTMHAVLFALAALLLGLARGYEAWIDLLLLGAATETLQRFVPGRGPGISDMLVDWSGIAIGALLVVLLRRSQRIGLFLKKQGIDEDAARF
jgi:hypothetical protein